MPKGEALPQEARIAAILMGSSCKEAVLMATNRIIPRVGREPGARSAMAFMAERPRGVAALPRPSRLAERFMQILPLSSGASL